MEYELCLLHNQHSRPRIYKPMEPSIRHDQDAGQNIIHMN